ncbi:Cyclin-dependent kinase 1 [Astathelohania contejeani]|uniref:Cyclin-dependent kinase 1 n=1 Tax=Astathelohania contejeani TaxID=164912 RepID=A0ABQ7HW51_9MICR|nr:Cyclin-dependent kinase 1 [Thelohania contejeani]
MADSYQKICKIGEGTYGVVYKAREKRTGNLYALKKIRLENSFDGVPATTIREISLLRSLSHSTIIGLHDVIYNNDKLYLVFEYLDVDLRRYLDCARKNNYISTENVLRISYQLITGIFLCHSKGILHRDLKPQNILVDSNGNVKLADFGLGRSIGIPLRTYTHDVITLWYRPPEILLGCKHYSAPVDMWSLGCIMAELYLFRPLFPGDCEIDQIYKIFRMMGTPTDEIWPGVRKLPNFQGSFPEWENVDLSLIIPSDSNFIDLVKKMLIYDPIKRISAKKALQHKLFDGMPPILE